MKKNDLFIKTKTPSFYSTKIVQFIQNESKRLGIDAISIGSVKKMEQLQDQYYFSNKYPKPTNYFPECKTIISAALSYNYEWNMVPGKTIGYIARYTTANFYRILSSKLKKLGTAIREKMAFNSSNKDFFRVFVNSEINDKFAAYVSGLGYYSKNSLISIKNQGPKFVLGELLLSIKIESFGTISKNCGDCYQCITACPTGALQENGIIKKDICIHHLSSELNWPVFIKGKKFLEFWGTRFFGCTDCIDVCPNNKNNRKTSLTSDKFIGFISTVFDFKNILNLKKEDYKSYFKQNQISAKWIPHIVLVRNSIASLYNLGKISLIKEYFKKIDNFNWNNKEKEYLKNFSLFLLKKVNDIVKKDV